MMRTLELDTDSDGGVTLYYEDINGKDRLFRIGEDGIAYEITYNDCDEEVYTPINLVEVLCAMAREEEV